MIFSLIIHSELPYSIDDCQMICYLIFSEHKFKTHLAIKIQFLFYYLLIYIYLFQKYDCFTNYTYST